MTMTYEEFKKDIERLRLYEETAVNDCHKADYRAEIIWLKNEYYDFAQRLKMEEMEK